MPVEDRAASPIAPGKAQGSSHLNPVEIGRYARHLLLPEIGMDGQSRLKAAKVLIVGAGGLGSPLALYLAAAGVGAIGIVDFDRVEESNLQRQIVHGMRDVGRPKVASAADRLANLNPFTRINAHDVRLTAGNAEDLVAAYDIVADGTDNILTRHIVNDACKFRQKTYVYGAVHQFEGQVTVFDAAKGPCYRCLFPSPPPPERVPSCAEGGVLGVLPGIVGTIQASEVIKALVGGGKPLLGRLLSFNAWTARFVELKLPKAAHCPLCGDHPTITGVGSDDYYREFCGWKEGG
ncbi:MAG: molybdopterin-synthase adenylyltransferase MoeB, partial [Planctomycetes bacterium]|nr:molybdopterin-synthase adenylyltransferase MoeB [Planctomycetota bacterium]